jgi:hypothetical protein
VPRLLGSLLAEVFALVLLLQSSARAQPAPGLTLRWSGPADCAEPANLESEVAALLPPGTELESAREFEVAIEALPAGGYRLQLREPSADATSVRVLGSCAEASEAAAVLIAMALDGGAQAAPSAPEPAPEPMPEEQHDDSVPVSPEPASVRGNWVLTAAALGDVRSLPEPSVGAMLGASWSLRALRLAWYARYLPAQPADDVPSGASAKFDLYAAALNGAFLWSIRAFAFGPALELELGYLRGRTERVPNAGSDGAAWAMVAGGALAEVRLHPRISLQFGALLGVPLWRPQFALQPDRPLFSGEPLVFRWFLGIGFRVGPTG